MVWIDGEGGGGECHEFPSPPAHFSSPQADRKYFRSMGLFVSLGIFFFKGMAGIKEGGRKEPKARSERGREGGEGEEGRERHRKWREGREGKVGKEGERGRKGKENVFAAFSKCLLRVRPITEDFSLSLCFVGEEGPRR